MLELFIIAITTTNHMTDDLKRILSLSKVEEIKPNLNRDQ